MKDCRGIVAHQIALTALHCTALHWIALHRVASHCTILRPTALHPIALHCTVSHCTVLYCRPLLCAALVIKLSSLACTAQPNVVQTDFCQTLLYIAYIYVYTVLATQQPKWGSDAWAAAHAALHEAVIQAVQNIVARKKYLLVLEDEFALVLTASSALKLQRFEGLDNLLQQHLLPTIVRRTLANCKATLVNMVHDLFMHLCCKAASPEAFTLLSQQLRGHITQQMYACLHSMRDADMVPADFVLAEDPKSASARATLSGMLGKLQAAAGAINQLSGLPMKGSYASIVKADARSTALQSALKEISSATATASTGFSFQWPVPEPTAQKATGEGPAQKAIFDERPTQAVMPLAAEPAMLIKSSLTMDSAPQATPEKQSKHMSQPTSEGKIVSKRKPEASLWSPKAGHAAVADYKKKKMPKNQVLREHNDFVLKNDLLATRKASAISHKNSCSSGIYKR